MKYKPHAYQQYMTDRILAQERIALFADMGLGKTSAILTALEKLIYEYFEVRHVLVIAPLYVAHDTWEDEIKKWSHLKHMTMSKILGSEKQRIRRINAKADIYTINRENVKWLIEYSKKERNWKFDCLVIDESASFKNPSAVRFKSLKSICELKTSNKYAVPRVIEATGTPAPKDYQNLWAQMYLLDSGEALGRNITAFRNQYCIPRLGVNGQRFYTLRTGAEKEIQEAVKHMVISLKWQDNIKMPECIYNYVNISLEDTEQKLIRKLIKERIINVQAEHKDNLVVVKNALSLSGKLLQIANGAIYIEDDSPEKGYVEIHNRKLDVLAQILEESEGKNVMVFYWFKHDYERLMRRFKKLNPKIIRSSEDIHDWNEGKIKMLLAHPASMGHGLNLQAGGSTIVWFSMTFDLELYQQANARLFRQGQKETVVIHHLIAKGTHDEEARRRLEKKAYSQDELKEAVKAQLNQIMKEE